MSCQRRRHYAGLVQAVSIGILLVVGNVAAGDVFQWEYVDPANPSLGKGKSATLAAGGAGATLEHVLSLSDRDLTKAYLYRANLDAYRLSSTILNNAFLAEASMYNVQADETSARGADLAKANLEFARLVNADLTGANVSGANLSRAFLSGAMLVGVDFSGANIAGGHFDRTVGKGFTSAQLYQTASYQQRHLGGINLSWNNLSGWDFSGQQMENAEFYETNLTNAKFSDAVITGASFSTSNLAPAQLYETSNYKSRQLDELEFSRMSLTGWNFTDQSLVRSRFSEAPISGANFDRAVMTNAFFSGGLSNVQSDVSFRGAKLNNSTFDTNGRWVRADFTGANLENARLSSNHFENSNFTDAVIRGAELRYVVGLTGFTVENLSADLRGAAFVSIENFAGTNFSGADIRGAEFTYATTDGFTVGQLQATRSFQERDLSGVDFEGNGFSGLDLSKFRLVGGDFNRANLTGANFSGADATGVSFMYATVTGLNLSDAIVRRGNFYNLSTRGLTREMFESTASYKLRQLDGVDLSSNNLSNWDFRNQDLREAKLESTLTGALFDHADLRGARLPSNRTALNLQQAILSDGTLEKLQIADGATLVIRPAPTLTHLTWANPRDPANQLPIPPGVKVTALTADIDGTLDVVLGAGDWKSTIVFKPQATVELDGVLKLSFDDSVPPRGSVGKFFNLFDWPTAGPQGAFDIVTNPNHVWDFKNLYTTGVVQLVSVVPEPSTAALLSTMTCGATLLRTRRRTQTS